MGEGESEKPLVFPAERLATDGKAGVKKEYNNLAKDGVHNLILKKRFSKGKLKWWPSIKSDTALMKAAELMICCQQGTPTKARFPNDWRDVIDT